MSRSVLDYTFQRQIDDRVRRSIQNRLHVTEKFIERLGLETELEGHQGCVNCLEWSADGRTLASASDDLIIFLWCPIKKRKIQSIRSCHLGNVFSVKFMPPGKENLIVSGAGDHQIHVHDLIAGEVMQMCTCPSGRVKRLANVEYHPTLFWAASEDGTIREFDLRTPHTCRSAKNVLIYLKKHLNDFAEAKCLAVNPCRPEMLAIGANDPYVRIYDRRMINLTMVKTRNVEPTLSSINNRAHLTVADESAEEDNLPERCVQYFTAGHLNARASEGTNKVLRNFTTTYLTFSGNGADLLVNLGGEHVYLFNIDKRRIAQSFNIPTSIETCNKLVENACGSSSSSGCNGSTSKNGVYRSSNKFKETSDDRDNGTLPNNVESIKVSANSLFKLKKFARAIRLYNLAIHLYPTSPVLYGNRAAAYLSRDWKGDAYAALRDCYMTLKLDPNHVKAFFRLARCLFRLNWVKEAKQCLEEFKVKFPSHSTSRDTQSLENEINLMLNQPQETGTFVNPDNICSPKEMEWRQKAFDYEKRFYGHCNTATDIKEANFFGSDGQYIVAGSDDGSIYFWNRETENNVRILHGDSSIVNCLQPHPYYCLLASSGIDPVVRLWSPQAEDGTIDFREVMDLDTAALNNQRRMKADPLDVVLMNWGIQSVLREDEETVRIRLAQNEENTYDCRPS